MKRTCYWLFSVACIAGLVRGSAYAQSTPIPAGSVVEATLVKPLDAKKSKVGDEVTLKVTKDLKAGDKVVIAKGSKIVGKLTEVKMKAQDQEESLITIAFNGAASKSGGELPLVATIQALSKPADDRTVDVSDSMRGTGPAASTGTLAIQATTQSGGSGKPERFGPQSQGVSGYNALGLRDSTVYSPAQNIHLDAGTQMILQVNGK